MGADAQRSIRATCGNLYQPLRDGDELNVARCETSIQMFQKELGTRAGAVSRLAGEG